MRIQLLCSLLIFASFASAQNIPGLPPTLFPSVISPAEPNSSDDIYLDVAADRCIGVLANTLDFPPTVGNNVVIVQVPGTVAVDAMFCFFPRRTVRLALGKIPQGTYTVELRLRPGFFPVTEPGLIVQRTPLVVGPPPFSVEQVPGPQPIGLAFLALSLLLLGSVFVRRVG